MNIQLIVYSHLMEKAILYQPYIRYLLAAVVLALDCYSYSISTKISLKVIIFTLVTTANNILATIDVVKIQKASES